MKVRLESGRSGSGLSLVNLKTFLMVLERLSSPTMIDILTSKMLFVTLTLRHDVSFSISKDIRLSG